MAKSLEQVLKDAVAEFGGASPHMGEEEPELGGAVSARAPKPDAAAALRVQLAAVSQSNTTYFQICVGMLVLLFAGALALVIVALHDPSQITTVFAATGISFMGIFAKMVRLWKDKVNSDMVLALANSLKPADLRTIVMVLVKAQK